MTQNRFICSGIVPMYTQSILYDERLKKEISKYELNRVAQVQNIVTSVMHGTLQVTQLRD